jgi:Zinc finger C-x8-C-x5-C-x3-H type (and similar)
MPQNGHAPMPVPSVPVPHQRMANGLRGGFEGARSPPNSKSMSTLSPSIASTSLTVLPPGTSHVPCKFFLQGACQAGNACPFAHDVTVGVCKYFQKVRDALDDAWNLH